MKKITYVRKPCKCPKCGGKVARIFYGMPAYSEKLQADLDTGRIVLGGCELTGHDPSWECINCGKHFYKVQK